MGAGAGEARGVARSYLIKPGSEIPPGVLRLIVSVAMMSLYVPDVVCCAVFLSQLVKY